MLLWLGADPRGESVPGSQLSIQEMLGGKGVGFAQALEPRVFQFPRDHGPHPEYRSEWWYFTGHLSDGSEKFGFELTFFRRGLQPDPLPRSSSWATRQFFMAHFALSDLSAEKFYSAERLARDALELAGAETSPLRVWVEDWSLHSAGEETFPMRLRASEGAVQLELTLDQGKRPVLQGEEGLSRKGPAPGEASYYYSLTRMPAEGKIVLGDRVIPVRGLAWMDREWSSRSLPPGVKGWDWFSLQLEDGRELMYYQLRSQDGSPTPESAGTLVEADGSSRPLGRVDLQILDTWTSPEGSRYPSGWRLRAQDLKLTVQPLLKDQELDVQVRYWEGAVRVTGDAQGKGYVELVGY